MISDNFVRDEPMWLEYDAQKAHRDFVQAIRTQAISEFLMEFAKEVEYQVLPNITDNMDKGQAVVDHIREKGLEIRREHSS